MRDQNDKVQRAPVQLWGIYIASQQEEQLNSVLQRRLQAS